MRKSVRFVALACVVAAAVVPTAVRAQGREVIVPTGGRGSATLSPAVRVGGLVFASGQLPARGDSTIETQTTSTLNNIKNLFEASGTSMNNAVKCTVFLVNLADFQGMNASYAKFWSPENPPPARSTVVVSALVVASAKLEIECIAAMPK